MNKIEERRLVYGWPKLCQRVPIPLIFCPGCQHGVVIRLLCEAIEELDIAGKVVGVNAATCGAVCCVLVGVDWIFGAHGRPCDIATAVKRVSRGKLIVLTYQGDGDALAIGAESTVHAAVRGEKIMVLMVNNGNFGTTGGQMAPTTIIGQKTTTTPYGRDPKREGLPFYGAEYLASMKGTAYSARGALNTPANCRQSKSYIKKGLQKQIDDVGFSYVEIISACPPDWHLSPLECQQRIENEVIPVFSLGEFKNVDSID